MELKGIGRRLEGLAEVPGFHGARTGRIGKLEVLLVRTGMGSAAEAAAREAAARLGPEALLCVGIAGGLLPHLRVGALVAAPAVLGPRPGDEPAKGDAALVKAALEAGAVAGDCLTVERPLVTPEEKALAARERGAAVCDMEAWFAARGAGPAVPFLALKSVSDTLDERLPEVSRFTGEDGKVRGGKAALHFALHPADAARAAAFLRNASRAAQALAEGVLRTLEALAREPGP
jgi:adenosylhomocysteine nucleosidase